MLFAASQGGSYLQLTEVAFLDGAGNDLSVGGVAGASSVYGAGYESARAFDKNTVTDWCSANGTWPNRLWYTHAAPVDVRGVRIRCSASAAWLPRNAADCVLVYSDDAGATWSGTLEFRLSIASGSFTPNSIVELSVADAPPIVLASQALPGFIQGRGVASYSAPIATPATGRLRQDFRQNLPTNGVVTDRVMFKATPSSPESPFAMGRVWLLRLVDGYKAWEGWSDAQGYYTATGLELGVEYIAVGIDPLRNHKATGAGPVCAVEAP